MTPISAALAAAIILHGASSTMLPSVQSDRVKASSILNASSWSVQVGRDIYYQPASLLGLSQNISHYYYARGSASAMTNEMRQRRVGGNENWHIFHVPEGMSLVQSVSMTAKQGDRRSSLSALSPLRHGQKLMDVFPKYIVKMESYSDGLSSALREQERSVAEKITEKLVADYLKGLVDLQSRTYEDDETRGKSEGHLLALFKKLNENACLQSFQKTGQTSLGAIETFNLHNVITYIPGEVENEGFTVLGAHFDSRPYGGPAPGANDNGSGVAALLAILDAFSSSGVKPKKPIYFVAFAAEEPGLWGSQNFVKSLQEGTGYGLDRVCGESSGSAPASFLHVRRALHNEDFQKSAAIILDEVGWVSSNLESETFNIETFDPDPERDTKPIMDHIAAASSEFNSALVVVHSSHPFGSDHMSFLQAKLPAALLINGDDEGYPNYHQSSDTFDQVNESYLAKIAHAACGGLFRLAHA